MKQLSAYRIIIFFIIMAVLAAALSIPAVGIYRNVRDIVIAELGKSAMGISIGVATVIEQDFENYKKLATADSYEDGSYDKEYYEKMLGIFHEIRVQTDVSYIYTEKQISDTETMYILDGEDQSSENFSPIGSTDVIDEFKIKTYTSKKPHFSGLMEYSQWGELISGYAPLIDPGTGEVISIVGTDISAQKVLVLFRNIAMVVIINFLIVLVVLGFLVYRLLAMTASTIESDYLTGLYSKGFFENYLKRLGKFAKKYAEPYSIIMLDIDHFKDINDRYGHPFGDQVLKSVAKVLKESTRSIDKCARYGGDEFAILLPGAIDDSIAHIGEKIRSNVAELALAAVDGLPVSVTVSIGIAQWTNGSLIDQVLDRADKALYKSKTSGKNKVTIS